MLALRVNEKTYELDIDPETPLLWVLRDHLGLTGTKYSCGIAQCRSCTVHLDGKAVASCMVKARQAVDKQITTIEGLSGSIAEALRDAWIAEDVPQCGYCQPGQIMSAAALLNETPHPTDADIDKAMSKVLCRCGTYSAIRRAIHRASRSI